MFSRIQRHIFPHAVAAACSEGVVCARLVLTQEEGKRGTDEVRDRAEEGKILFSGDISENNLNSKTFLLCAFPDSLRLCFFWEKLCY